VSAASGAGTVLGALVAAVRRAATHNPDVQARPAAILWPDHDRQWEKVAPVLRQVMPELLTLGEYDPDSRTGPAIWLKCMMARTLDAADWSEDTIPVVYLPGVGRLDLRALETCPKHLQPLAELQYRGAYWSQANQRDWSILAFLKARDGGLGFDVAQDAATLEAMLRALEKLADTTVADLRGRRLEAADFDQLLSSDPARDVLRWLDDPPGVKERWGTDVWGAFRAVCRSQLDLDPETDGELSGAERLGRSEGVWACVWDRFAEAPSSYPNIPDLLRRAQPSDLGLFDDRSTWPSENETREEDLGKELLALEGTPLDEAARKVLALEGSHGSRREWVWARMGAAPLALALEHLAELATITQKSLPGSTIDELVSAHSKKGWRADAALVGALAAVSRQADVAAVGSAVRALYAPWAEEHARRLQDLLTAGERVPEAQPPSLPAGGVLMFADGLRFDVGRQLERVLTAGGLDVELHAGCTALPTVTATCKPAVSPIAGKLEAGLEDTSFNPRLAEGGGQLTTHRFRKLLEEEGYAVLAEGMGDREGRGWVEAGSLDRYGHDQGWKLARRVAEEVRELADRINDLLDWGWREVTVVTDHGWLLLPGGLPKTDLPSFLTETRWGRCSVLKASASSPLPTVPWRWCPEVHIALAPGISCFRAGMEYAHGGVSIQELVVPTLRVQRRTAPAAAAVSMVSWRGMRCRLEITGGAEGIRVDIRSKAAVAESSLVQEPKEIGADGTASLVVAEDRHEGAAAVVVLLDAAGTVVAKAPTTVGEEE
jgi:hypothetical protein